MDFDDVKKEIRSILLTFPKGCSLTEFNHVYKDMLGCRLPFRDFCFHSDVEFLKSMPDVVSLRSDKSGDYLLKGIADEKSQHIQNLVCKQKLSKQKASYRSRVVSNSKSCKTSAISSSSLSGTVISKPFSNSRRMFSVPPRFKALNLKKSITKEHMQEAVELVLSFPDGLHLSNFMSCFEKHYGKKFSFRSVGYATLDKCLESSPDLILEPIDNDTLIYHVSFVGNTSRVESDMPESFLRNRESMQKGKKGETSMSDRSENYKSITGYTLNDDKENVQALSSSKGSLGHLNLSSRSNYKPAIPETMRKKCLKVLEKYPNGMYASDFPLCFEEVNLVTFDLHCLGYNSLVDFIDDLPDIFIRRPVACSKKDWVIYPANFQGATPAENLNLSDSKLFRIESIILNTREILQGYPEGLSLENFLYVYSINCNEPIRVRDLGFDELEHFLLSIAERVPLKMETNGNSKTVHFIAYDDIPIKPPVSAPGVFEAVPSDAASPDSKFVLYQLPSDFDYSKYIPVYTSSIFNPDLIYLQIRGANTTDALVVLNEQLDSFYRGSLSNKYKMKNADIKVGAICAAVWPRDNHWYRAKIISIQSLEMVHLFYVDYGTNDVVSVSLLRYIRQEYMELPAQALKSQLAFLKPKEETWNLAVMERLLGLCQDISLMAKIEERSVDGTLSVTLCDTNGEKVIYINDVLLKEGFAENKNALYSQLDGQVACGINMPPFQAEGAHHFQRSPCAVDSSSSNLNDVVLNLLQNLALCYAQNPQLKQQHIQSGLLNVFFNTPSSAMLGNPNPVMNPLAAATGLVGLSPLSYPYAPNGYLCSMSDPLATKHKQSVEPESPSSKEVKEIEPSLDDSDDDVFDDDDDESFQAFCERVLANLKKRHVKRVSIGTDYIMHVIVWNALPYASSGDISALIWYNRGADYLFRRLQLKQVSFQEIEICEEGNEELFNQLKRYNVKGIRKDACSKSCVHLHPLTCVIKILNMFGHPSTLLRLKIMDEISSFDLSDPIWQEFSESEVIENEEVNVPETDDDKINRLCLFDLIAMKEDVYYRRLKMVNKLRDPENNQCIEEIEKLEQLYERIVQQIQEIKKVCERFS